MVDALDVWHIDEESYSVDEAILGKGKFGVVHLGEWNGTVVALKFLFNKDLESNLDLFRKEIGLMKELHHPCIVQFLGFSRDHAFGDLVIIMEYLSNGSVEEYILKNNSKITLQQKVCWCSEMAQALAYLHNRKPTFLIHRDVKPSNFMLTTSLRCKLGDFGISRLFKRSVLDEPTRPKTTPEEDEEDGEEEEGNGSIFSGTIGNFFGLGSSSVSEQELDQTSNVGTVRYMAPEVRGFHEDQKHIKQKNPPKNDKPTTRYSVQADVFSLGMVYYFVFEGMNPKVNGANDPVSHFAQLQAGKRPICSVAPPAARRIIELCLRMKPIERPTSLELISLLKGIPIPTNSGSFLGIKFNSSSANTAAILQQQSTKFKELVVKIEERRSADGGTSPRAGGGGGSYLRGITRTKPSPDIVPSNPTLLSSPASLHRPLSGSYDIEEEVSQRTTNVMIGQSEATVLVSPSKSNETSEINDSLAAMSAQVEKMSTFSETESNTENPSSDSAEASLSGPASQVESTLNSPLSEEVCEPIDRPPSLSELVVRDTTEPSPPLNTSD